MYGSRYLFQKIGLLATTLYCLRSIASLKGANFVDGFGDLQAQEAISGCVKMSVDVNTRTCAESPTSHTGNCKLI